jgi:CDP-diacylglycerol--glycerol-3-phosphate 3-phosphatidyltransferase
VVAVIDTRSRTLDRGPLSLPNSLSLARLFLVAPIMLTLAWDFPAHQVVAAFLFLLAAASDFADGVLARSRGEVTTLGKFLDPLSDKLLIAGTFLTLVQLRELPAWMAVVILARELVITLLRVVAAEQGIIIAASRWGKTKTTSQVAATLWVILGLPLGLGAMGVAVVLTLYSGLDYLWRFRSVLSRGASQS